MRIISASVDSGARDVRAGDGATDWLWAQAWVARVRGECDIRVTEHTQMVYDEIAGVMRRAQRDLRRAVYPREVVVRLPYRRAEGTVRRDMVAMWRMGMLERVGGDGSRRGYRLRDSGSMVRYDRAA